MCATKLAPLSLAVLLLGGSAVAGTPAVATRAPAEVMATTASAGPPEFTGTFYPTRLYTREKYTSEIVPQRGVPPIVRLSGTLSAEARFGSISCAGKTWVVAVDGAAGEARVFVDLDRDGDPTNDPPQKLVHEKGKSVATIQADGIPLQLAMLDEGLPGMLCVHSDTERRGIFDIAGRTLAFALTGQCGRYDGPRDVISFDLDRDGAVDSDRNSDERFHVEDRVLALDGATYEFEVDPAGAWLRLTPSTAPAPPRASLALGAEAPDFEFVDLLGASHQLSDYRGQVVLLYVWATHCGPCRKEIPGLVDLYSQNQGRGFEIVGLLKDDVEGDVLAYDREHGITWPQSLQASEGPILATYRVEGTPTTFLIDRAGKIAGRGLREGPLAAKVAEMVGGLPECPPAASAQLVK